MNQSENANANLNSVFDSLPFTVPEIKTTDNIRTYEMVYAEEIEATRVRVEAENAEKARLDKIAYLARQKKQKESRTADAMLRDSYRRANERAEKRRLERHQLGVEEDEAREQLAREEEEAAQLKREREKWVFRPLTSTIAETQKLFDDLAVSNPEIYEWISNNQHRDYPGYTAHNDSKAFKYMLDYTNTKKVMPLPEAGGIQPEPEIEVPDDFQTLLLDELRKRTELHHDDAGELVGITLDGEKFHIDELLEETPDEIVGTQEELDVTYGHEDAFEELRLHSQIDSNNMLDVLRLSYETTRLVQCLHLHFAMAKSILLY